MALRITAVSHWFVMLVELRRQGKSIMCTGLGRSLQHRNDPRSCSQDAECLWVGSLTSICTDTEPYRLRNALKKMNAGPRGGDNIMWTSLREEPVLVSYRVDAA